MDSPEVPGPPRFPAQILHPCLLFHQVPCCDDWKKGLSVRLQFPHYRQPVRQPWRPHYHPPAQSLIHHRHQTALTRRSLLFQVTMGMAGQMAGQGPLIPYFPKQPGPGRCRRPLIYPQIHSPAPGSFRHSNRFPPYVPNSCGRLPTYLKHMPSAAPYH